MSPQTLVIWIGAFFAMFIVGGVTLYVLSIFWDDYAVQAAVDINQTHSTIFTNNTWAANATTKMSEGIYNIFEQMPNVGKLAGVSLIVGVMGLLGVGGYLGYQKIRGY